MAVAPITPTRKERRTMVRRSCAQPELPVTAFVSHDFWQAAAHNLSAVGIGLRLGHNVEAGALVRVGLFNRSANLWLLKMMRVIHATPQTDGSWLVGCAFVQPLTNDQLKELLD